MIFHDSSVKSIQHHFFSATLPPDPTFPAPPFAHVAGSSYAPAVGQPHPAPPGALK